MAIKVTYIEDQDKTRFQDGTQGAFLPGKIEIAPEKGESLDEIIYRASQKISVTKNDLQAAFFAYISMSEAKWAWSTRQNAITACNHYVRWGKRFNTQDNNLIVANTAERRRRIKNTRRHWLDFISYLEDRDISVTSINNILATCRGVVNYLKVEWGIELQGVEIQPIDWYDMKYQWPDHVLDRIMQSQHPFAKYARFHLCTTLRVCDLIEVRGEHTYSNGEWVTIVVDMKKVNRSVQPIVPLEVFNEVNAEGKLIPYTQSEYVAGLRNFLKDEFGDEEFEGKKVIRRKITTIKIPIWATPRPTHMLRAMGATFLARKGMTLDMIAQVYTGHRKLDTLRKHYLGGYDNKTIIDKLKNIFQ
jgi:integrase